MTGNSALGPDSDFGKIEDILLDRPIASIYDIAYLYGKLHSAHLSETYSDTGVDEEYISKRLTPEVRTGYYDQEVGMVSVPIDVTGDTAEVVPASEVHAAEGNSPDTLAGDTPLFPEPVDRETLIRVGYSRQDSRAAGHNMSLAHDVSGKKPSKCSGYVEDLFGRWIDTDISEDVASEHPDGWILQQLRSFAKDEDALSTLKDEVETGFESIADGDYTGVISLRIRDEEGGRFKYPGEFGVLNEVTRRRWIENQMRSYSEATDSSGQATDFITGDDGEVFGLSDSPLQRYQGKMAESFPNLTPNNSWRNRPLSSDSAFAVIAGSAILNEFVQLLRGNSFSETDTRVYIIPYVPAPTPQEAIELYKLARQSIDDNGQVISVLDDALTSPMNPLSEADIRLHYAVVYKPEMKTKILIEEPSIPASKIRAIANAHAGILRSDLLATSPGQHPLFPEPEYGRLSEQPNGNSSGAGDDEGYSGSKYLNSESDAVFSGLLHGGYFSSTFFDRYQDSDSVDYGSSDPIVLATRQCLGPDATLSPEWLLQQYVPRLEAEQRAEFGNGEIPIPHSLITRQYVQYQALAHAGVLDDKNRNLTITRPVEIPNLMDEATKNYQQMADQEIIEDREQRLNQFIETHPALSEDTERQGAFLLGALVGRVAAYQRWRKQLSKTVVRQHPIDSLTRKRFSTTLSQVLDKNTVYSEQDDQISGLMNGRYVERLNDIIHTSPPTEWELSTEDLRMHYALGLSYGSNDRSLQSDDDE